jgi:hypothetical protein
MERAQLQSVGSSSSRNLLGQTGFSYVNAFSLTEWVSKDFKDFGRARGCRRDQTCDI